MIYQNKGKLQVDYWKTFCFSLLPEPNFKLKKIHKNQNTILPEYFVEVSEVEKITLAEFAKVSFCIFKGLLG